MATTLAPDRVHLWYRLTEGLDETSVARAVDLLSDSERRRGQRFMFARDRRDYIAAHELTRVALSRYAVLSPEQWRFQEGAHGKPSLVAEGDAPPLSFNLSHTHGLVACAIAPGADVGIDVEGVDRQVVTEEVAQRFFTPSENADLKACPPDERKRRFFELWTLKEAYIKAIGTGLSLPLNTFGFSLNETGSIAFMARPDIGVDVAAWQFALFAPTDRHSMAVAVRGDHAGVWRIDATSHDEAIGLRPVRTSRPRRS